jgi:hypothetical protein
MSKNKRKRGPPDKPEQLYQWFKRWVQGFRSAYRGAVESGYPADVVIWGMPRTDRVDDPPPGFDIQRLAEARANIDARLPKMRGVLDDPPPPGLFYAVASRSEGPMKGTVVCLLQAPQADEELP